MQTTRTADGNVFKLEGEKQCPKCGRVRDMQFFGMRKMKKDGTLYRVQSWCVDCRGKKPEA